MQSMKDSENKKDLPQLPPSSDKDFWGEDAEVISVPEPKAPTGVKHTIQYYGPEAVCVSCPSPHSMVRVDGLRTRIPEAQ